LVRTVRLPVFADFAAAFFFTFLGGAFFESAFAGAEALPLFLAGLGRADLAGRTVFFRLPPFVILRGVVFAIQDPLTFTKSINYDDYFH
jgi:hypothetical protein